MTKPDFRDSQSHLSGIVFSALTGRYLQASPRSGLARRKIVTQLLCHRLSALRPLTSASLKALDHAEKPSTQSNVNDD